jgi:hypothetical protein
MIGWQLTAFQNFQLLWSGFNADRIWALVLALCAAATTIGLFALSRTKWGKNKPLTKCLVYSVIAHAWLLMYAYGTKLNGPGSPTGSLDAPSRIVSIIESPPPAPDPVDEAGSNDAKAAFAEKLAESLEKIDPTQSLDLPPTAPLPSMPFDEAPLADLAGMAATESSPLAADKMEALPPPSSAPMLLPNGDMGSVQAILSSSAMSGALAIESAKRVFDDQPLAQEYLLRNNPNRFQIAQQFGASAETEDSVARGLHWLARTQLPDGSWNAAATGAGQETRQIVTQSYQGIGRNADTGITGLALLAFLSGGHTHVQGEYASTVRKGMEYLVSQQLVSGDLSGKRQQSNLPADVFSRMYCHGIAAFAIGECYAMTGDPSLQRPASLAASYTLKCQDPTSGGWRYIAQDRGDLSQFGWQALALSSVQHGGLEIPESTWKSMSKFLDSVSGGKHGGLGKYRAQESPTTTMTAEKLACHLLLNQPLSAQAENEARQELLRHLPGTGEDNVYYWYYGTLAMFQFQDDAWRQWNDALKSRLMVLQEPQSSYLSGSFPPDAIWGGYGGRVYSTAMSCLCLEVYYRYLPLYAKSKLAQDPTQRPEMIQR